MTAKKQSIAQTVNQYGNQLLGFIRGKVASDEDAEDVIQDVWYQLSNLDDILSLESISGWLYRVAKNKITDRFRKKKTVSLEDFAVETDDGDVSFKAILLADERTPEDAYFKKLFWDELLQALDELPKKQRSVFVQHELEDKSLQDIADQSGENIKTIISRKGYAVKHLRLRLNTLYQEFLNYN